MTTTRTPRTPLLFALLGGIVALAVTWFGSIAVGVAAGVLTWLVGMGAVAWSVRAGMAGPEPDPTRRRLLAWAGLGGLAAVVGGAAVGRIATKLARPDASVVQEAAATDIGTEYMELIQRAYHPDRSGDLQLVLAPFNSANYAEESLSLVPNDPRTSHASVWMYLERIPLVAYGPGVIEPTDSEERATLADLAPTTASLVGLDWPGGGDGRVLPGLRATGVTPKVVVTYVIDGGGWNVLNMWDQDWPVLKQLMRGGANYRNAIVGSFPAVTACAHANIGTGAFPWTHGITGHNIRDGAEVRKAYGEIGSADPSDILVPTLADRWHDATGAWVGEIGYQIWHLGMLGAGGTDRPGDDLPVAVYWNDVAGEWASQNPDRYRLPASVPGLEVFEAHRSAFVSPDWDAQFTPKGRAEPCCEPPIVQYQGDLIEASFDSEPIGEGATSLLYTTYKAPDYTGHTYNMQSQWEGLVLRAVDEQLRRLVTMLDDRFPGEYVVFVTADHGQCPLPDSVDGVRLDPIQLEKVIEQEFGAGLTEVVQSVVPSEVYLHADQLWDAGATPADVAAFLRHLSYRQTIGPYVPRSAIEEDMLAHEQFAAVFDTSFLGDLGDVGRFGATAYTAEGVEIGIPPRTLIDG